jgi:hypothetical protein
MPKLRVTFEDMFLLANGNLLGGSVLLPSKDHTLHIVTGAFTKEGLTQVEIKFDDTSAEEIIYCLEDNRKLTSRPGNDPLVRLEDVFLRTIRISKELLVDQVPKALNARVLLPKGFVRGGEPRRYPGVKDVPWTVGEAKNQHLTDTLVYERDMPEEPTMIISGPLLKEPIKVELTPSNGVFEVTIKNVDKPCERKDPDEWVLDQFELLFGLTSAAKEKKEVREKAYPRGKFKMPKDDRSSLKILSECLPICGGAQCDPPHPPV